MPTSRSKLGAQGEAVAAAHLEAAGLRIIERNFRTRYGEVDLVAEDGDTVVFVEVKTRRDASYGPPEESVTPTKRERLAMTAETFLQEHGWEQRDWRLDVIGITLKNNAPAEINHLRAV